MSNLFLTISPIDGSLYLEREYAAAHAIESALTLATKVQTGWRKTSITERAAVCQ